MVEECRSVQEIAGHRNVRNLDNVGKTGFLELRRLSQLGYGDVIRKCLENKALRQGDFSE